MDFIININRNVKPIYLYFAFETQKSSSVSLKALIKYPLSMFILLLIGYSQLFAPVYRGNASYVPTKKSRTLEYGQALDTKAADAPTIFIAEEEEEEDDRISFKRYLEESSLFSYTYIPEYFIRDVSSFSFVRDSSCFSFFKSPYLVFNVFRL